jgi:hypothetical protein
MRLALCLYGQPRFIDNDFCSNSIKTHIFSKYDVDVFAHCWFDENADVYATSDWSKHHQNYVNKECIKIIQEKYSPKAFLYEEPKQFKQHDHLKERCSTLPYFSENNFYNLQSHLYSFESSLRSLINYVEETKTTYDFVISTRYDILVSSFPKPDSLSRSMVYVDGKYQFSDGIYLFDYEFIEQFKPFSEFEEITKTVPLFTSEEYKKHTFIRNNGMEKVSNSIGIYTSLARSKTDNTGQI